MVIYFTINVHTSTYSNNYCWKPFSIKKNGYKTVMENPIIDVSIHLYRTSEQGYRGKEEYEIWEYGEIDVILILGATPSSSSPECLRFFYLGYFSPVSSDSVRVPD